MGPVEPVDFVDEQQRRLAHLTPHAGLFEGLLQVSYPREHRRKLLKLIACRLGQQARNGRLAGAGRSPKDHRGETLGLGHPANGTLLTEQMLLAHHFAETLGSQPVCER